MKKLATLFLNLTILLSLVCVLGISAAAQSSVTFRVPVYVDANDPSKGISSWEEKTITQYTDLSSDKKTYWTYTDENQGWYVAKGTINLDSVTCEGDIKLVLLDDCNLTISTEVKEKAGLYVQEDSSLTIYAQSTGNKMGKLTAKADRNAAVNDAGGAGIGGESGIPNGKITVNGGYIVAEGARGGAGIGGGHGAEGNHIIINGGYIDASSDITGAGIGGGQDEGAEDIVINGGEVHATGGCGKNFEF